MQIKKISNNSRRQSLCRTPEKSTKDPCTSKTIKTFCRSTPNCTSKEHGRTNDKTRSSSNYPSRGNPKEVLQMRFSGQGEYGKANCEGNPTYCAMNSCV